MLCGPRLMLRQPRPGDAAARLALGRDPDITRMFGADPSDLPPLTEAETTRWVEGIAMHPHAWIVEHNGRLLGEARRWIRTTPGRGSRSGCTIPPSSGSGWDGRLSAW